MKLFRSSLLMMSELAAFGWFILRHISFIALLPLIPLGVLFYYLHRYNLKNKVWFYAITTTAAVLVIAHVTAVGIFNGKGFWMLLFLMVACALLAVRVKSTEWARISGWWMIAFLLVYLAMVLATAFGIKLQTTMPMGENMVDVWIFYLLVFLEPLSMGAEYRASPLALGLLLIPFAVFAYLALGEAAFDALERPYLSVWSGVSLASFHHLEGIILCLLYGAGTLRLSHLFIRFSKYYCNKQA